MRSVTIPSAILFLLIPVVAFAADSGLFRLGLVEDGVQVLIRDTTDWTDATVNVPLGEGDRIWVPDGGKAELQIRGGVYVRSDGGTALDILSANGDAVQFYLDRGHIYINNRRGGIRIVQIDTPLMSVRSFDNSVMMIDVTEDGVTEVSVLKGYVTAEDRSGATRVGAGKTLTIREGTEAELAPIGAPDEWERWNTDRDRELTAWSESSRYLPDELHDYSSDFDDNGRWDYVSDYGYVWYPTVVAADWAPYTVGRWVWIRGSYVWIAYDPWGWAPGHYGRWVFVASRGWCWVPPVAGAAYWGPGYVGWTVTPSYVAWVPLAPGEIYYGYGYYGPGSVNITTVNVNTVVVNRTYVNATHGHGVNVVKRDTFGTGFRVPVKAGGDPFSEGHQRREKKMSVVPPPERPQHRIVLVPPEERDQVRQLQRPPERRQVRQEFPGTRPSAPVAAPPAKTERRQAAPPSSVQPPSVKTPAVQHQPPERVQKNRPEVLKNERRLVKQRESSVFHAQPPENLPVKKQSEPRVIIRKPAPVQQQGGGQPQKKPQGEKREGRPSGDRR